MKTSFTATYSWGMTNYPVGPHLTQIRPNWTIRLLPSVLEHIRPHVISCLDSLISYIFNALILLCVKQQINFSKHHLL